MTKIQACYKCTERHEGCHGTCERYLSEIRKRKKEQEEISKQKADHWILTDTRTRSVERMKKRHNKH